MLCINMKFSAGRFHATPWGRHVNEAAVEWPPSPWRMLRALVSVWKHTLEDRIPESRLVSLLSAISAPPLYDLPPATLGHSRHYMSLNKLDRDKTSLIFDAFIVVGRDIPLMFAWPDVELDPQARSDLEALLRNMNYFGRSESWCEASMADRAGFTPNCVPEVSWDGPATDRDPVNVLAPILPLNFKQLISETTLLRKEAWSDPPGSRWLTYARPPDCFSPAPAPRTRRIAASRPTTARFALDSAVLPLLTDTIRIGENMRSALQSIYGRIHDGAASRIFSGKDDSGKTLTGHTHCHYLPSDDDGDGRLDHITFYSPSGFGAGELAAMDVLRTLRQKGGRPSLNLMLLSHGCADSFSVPQLASSKTWISRTPFVLVRHPKKNGKDSPEEQLRLELNRRGFPEPASVSPIPFCKLKSRKIRWLEFRRWREHGSPPLALGFGFRIEFSEPVSGPIVLGYGAHFGLGQFVPVEGD
jgi:CRISPR-associated protein Csb2